MAYANLQRSRNRTTTTVLVGALHLAVGYALVVGLGVSFVPKTPPKMDPIDFPLPEPTMSPPPETKTPPRDPIDTNITVDPIILLPQPSFTPGPAPIPTGTGDGIDVVTFPTPEPTFSPRAPTFLPKPATPIGNPANWASADDYPTRDLREGHQGITRFRLSVGVDGRVSGCTVTGSSGFPSLDAAACAKLTARGRFKAATGENGEKIAGTYASSVKWQIPED